MKKTKLLALTLAVVIMMMGAGYAIWTDQVFLTSTVRTGNFDMQLKDVTLRTGDRQSDNLTQKWHHFDWTHGNTKDNVSFDATSAIVEFKDLYPGGVVQVDLTTKNMGTIPAKLESIKVDYVDGNAELLGLLRAKSTWKADIKGAGNKDDWSHLDKKFHGIQDAMNVLVENTKTKGLVIEPNGLFALGDDTEDGCIQFMLDPSAGNTMQNQAVRFKITFNWEQWSTNPGTDTYTLYGGDGDIQPLDTNKSIR